MKKKNNLIFDTNYSTIQKKIKGVKTMNTAVETITNPKDLLERKPISKGDFVTPRDDSDIVKLYVVKSINDNLATLIYLNLTHEMDDIELKEIAMPVDYLIFADDSFASVGGLLWQVREAVLSNRKCTSCNIDIHI